MKSLLTTAFIFFSVFAQAQNFMSWRYGDRYFSFALGTGTASYFGELNQPNEINTDLSLLSLAIEARLLNRVSARLEASVFQIAGTDRNAPDSSFQRQRNLSFESRGYHAQLHAIYYLKPYRGDYYKRWRFDPYFFSGVGYLNHTPTAKLGGERFNLRDAQTEGVSYEKWVITVPVGLGAKFKVNEFLNVNLEASYHFAFTDYLDDVSNTYATEFASSTASLLSDRKEEIGVVNPVFYDQIRPGSERGNPDDQDRFFQVAIKIEVFLPPNLFAKKKKAIVKKPSAY